MSTKWIIIGACLLLNGLLVISQPMRAVADRATSASTELLLDGEDIVTTVTRTAQRVSDSPEAVTVISADDIKASGATNIPELLRSVPGVDVMQPNASQQNVSIRGFNQQFANTVLVMVDGRRINEDVNDSVFWTCQPILLSRIKRIEVVRGPGSVLYGADAFSGVINIILKTPSEIAADGKKAAFTEQYEEHAVEFAEGNATAQSKDKAWSATLGAGYHGVIGAYQGQADRPQDSSRAPIYTLDVQRQTPKGSILLSANATKAAMDLSSDVTLRDAAFTTDTLALSYIEDHGANPVTARIYETNFKLSGNQQNYSSTSQELDLQQQRPIGARNSLSYGLTYRGYSALTTVTGPDRHTETVSSQFVQDEDRLSSNTTFFAGCRNDHDSVYGNQLSSRFSLVNHLATNQSVRLSYGTAFSAPTYAEEYLNYQAPSILGLSIDYLSNLNLKPEKIRSTEAGYRVDFSNGYAGVNIYHNDITDTFFGVAVQFAPSPFPAGIPTEIQFQNQGNAHAEGLEMEGERNLAHGWSCLANYSYEDVKNQQGQTLDFSPHGKINLILRSDLAKRWTTYFAGHYVSSSSSNGMPLRAYSTVDGRIAYRIGKTSNSWTAAIDVTNLLDDHHHEYIDSVGTNVAVMTSEEAQRTVRIELSGAF